MIKALDVNYKHEITLDSDTEPKTVFLVRNLSYSQRTQIISDYDELIGHYTSNKMANEAVAKLVPTDLASIKEIDSLKELIRATNDKSYDTAIKLLVKLLVDVKNVPNSVEHEENEFGKSVSKKWIETNMPHNMIIDLVVKAVNCSFLDDDKKKQ